MSPITRSKSRLSTESTPSPSDQRHGRVPSFKSSSRRPREDHAATTCKLLYEGPIRGLYDPPLGFPRPSYLVLEAALTETIMRRNLYMDQYRRATQSFNQLSKEGKEFKHHLVTYRKFIKTMQDEYDRLLQKYEKLKKENEDLKQKYDVPVVLID